MCPIMEDGSQVHRRQAALRRSSWAERWWRRRRPTPRSCPLAGRRSEVFSAKLNGTHQGKTCIRDVERVGGTLRHCLLKATKPLAGALFTTRTSHCPQALRWFPIVPCSTPPVPWLSTRPGCRPLAVGSAPHAVPGAWARSARPCRWCVGFRHGTDVPAPTRDAGIWQATGYRYLHEGITVSPGGCPPCIRSWPTAARQGFGP